MPRPVPPAIRGHPHPNPTSITAPSLGATARALGLSTDTLIAYLQANGGFPVGSVAREFASMRIIETET